MSKVFYRDDNVMLIQGDCLEVMPKLKRKFDAIITDPPYGTTACKWDTIIPFDKMWECVNERIKDTGAICLFGSEPFSSVLRVSNLKQYKYDWVWEKSRATGHVHSKNKPMKKHEIISVFSNGVTVHATQSERRMPYNPQELKMLKTPKIRKKGRSSDVVMAPRPSHRDTIQEYENYPTSILKFNNDGNTLHPTQKPVALLEYLIKTYTNEGETVLDFTSGSGTTLIAALNTGRRAVGIEMDEKYCQITVERIEAFYKSHENKV